MFKLHPSIHSSIDKNDNDSSIDSHVSETQQNNINSNHDNNIEYKCDNFFYEMKKNELLKNEMKLKIKENKNEFNDRKSVNWDVFYKALPHKALNKEEVNKTEIELRINSILNKYDKNYNHHKNHVSSNKLFMPNKYPCDNSSGFIMGIISSNNKYEEKKEKKDTNNKQGKKILTFISQRTKEIFKGEIILKSNSKKNTVLDKGRRNKNPSVKFLSNELNKKISDDNMKFEKENCKDDLFHMLKDNARKSVTFRTYSSSKGN